ncbi:hypothetical protein CRUP_021270, partial [Coryphaenoides rupestris]
MSEDQLIGFSNSSAYDFGHDSTRVTNLVFSGPAFVVLVAMMVTLVVVIVLGNALVIFAFKVDKSLRRQCNYYFLNLAISDFLVGAVCIPLYMPYVLTGRWPLGRALCKLWLVMDYLLCSASVFNIVLISYDRFLSVTRARSEVRRGTHQHTRTTPALLLLLLVAGCRPSDVCLKVSYRARQGVSHHTVLKMLAVWLLAFALYGPAIIFWELAVGRSRVPTGQCFAEFYSTWYFLLSASMLEFFSPLLSVAFFHLSIYLSIRRRRILHSRGAGAMPAAPPPPEPHHQPHQHHPHQHPPGRRCQCRLASVPSHASHASPPSSSSPSASSAAGKPELSAACRPSRLSRDKKIAKSLAVIVCVFAICWAPYTLLMIIRAACRGRCIPHHWYEREPSPPELAACAAAAAATAAAAAHREEEEEEKEEYIGGDPASSLRVLKP